MKREFLTTMVGVLIGYALVQGLSYVQQHYLWTFFYR
jgi:hypothetical protein